MEMGLEEELKDRLHIRTLEKGWGASGCISEGNCFKTDKGDRLFVKSYGGRHARVMFEGENESLKHINATNTIRAPKVCDVIHDFDETHRSAIVLEFLDIKNLSAAGAKNLGQNLAHLHDYNNKVIRYNKKASKWIGRQPPSAKPILESRAKESKQQAQSSEAEHSDDEEENQFSKHGMKAKGHDRRVTTQSETEYAEKFVPEADTEQIDKFGFHVPTSCGSIPQVNEWTDEWVPFFARHRLDKAIRSLLSEHGDRDLIELWSSFQLNIHKLFKDYDSRGENVIVPALLHGDLWSGNVAELKDGEAVIYDPSAFYGHSEYEFGIVRMFGGIPASFEQSYFEIMPKKKLFEKRSKLYQLFHHLNHWDHFGSGYRSSSLGILRMLDTTTKSCL